MTGNSKKRTPGGSLVLGIETSCDETGAAIVQNGRRILSSKVASQVPVHSPFGGVVPELAGRKHLENLVPAVRAVLEESSVAPSHLNAVAITSNPGLLGALLVGATFAKALSLGWSVPLLEVNHLYAHALSIFLDGRRPRFPFLALVVSGGHTTLFEVTGPCSLNSIGQTRDDAAGEAIDKIAKFLGLGYPGGPVVDRLAAGGQTDAIRFPRGLGHSRSYDFSFSGLKTAVINHVLGSSRITGRLADHRFPPLPADQLRDLLASFQEAVVDVLTQKTLRAAEAFSLRTVVVSGGVAANSRLRQIMGDRGKAAGVRVLFPTPSLCTDNAAMIAAAAHHRLLQGDFADLSFRPSARMKEVP